jgi:hypothetical protein
VTLALTTAPKPATPRALPTERANIAAPVVTPRDSQPTADCAAITEGAAAKPKPKPMTKHGRATSHSDESPSIGTSSSAPANAITAPIRMVPRKPMDR